MSRVSIALARTARPFGILALCIDDTCALRLPFRMSVSSRLRHKRLVSLAAGVRVTTQDLVMNNKPSR